MKTIALSIAIFAAWPAYASLPKIATNPEKRDSLRLIAFDGRCSYFMSSPNEQLSPSTTDTHVWQTCWNHVSSSISSIQLGPDYGSAIYKVRIDCSSKEYAIIESAAFYKQLWEGGELRLPEINSPSWRDIDKTFEELKAICAQEGLTQFDGPASDASL